MHLCACDGKACMRGHVNNVNDDYDKSATGGRVYYGGETKETESAPVEEQKQEENKPAETVEETKTEQVSVEKTEA